MASINIEKINSPKNINIKTDSNSNNIAIKRSGDPFNNPPVISEQLGLDYLTADAEEPDYGSEMEGSESGMSVESQDPMMSERYANHPGYPGQDQGQGQDQQQQEYISPEDLKQRKAFALYNINRYAKQGYVMSRHFSLNHDLDELEGEVIRIEQERDLDNGLQNCKDTLLMFTNAVETINTNYGPNWIKLNGWSAFIAEEYKTHKYDDVFIKLWHKYSSKLPDSPEFSLLWLLGCSAFLFHTARIKAEAEYAASQRGRGGYTQFPGASGCPEMKEPSNYEDLMNELSGNDSDTNSVTSYISGVSGVSARSGRSVVSAGTSASVQGLSISIPDKTKPVKKPRGRPRKVKEL